MLRWAAAAGDSPIWHFVIRYVDGSTSGLFCAPIIDPNATRSRPLNVILSRASGATCPTMRAAPARRRWPSRENSHTRRQSAVAEQNARAQ